MIFNKNNHLLPLLLFTFPSFAQDIQTEIITVTGTHIVDNSIQGRLSKVVINAEEIATLAPNSFADVLRGVPGIDIMEQGGLGGLTFLSIRGGDPNFVTILIDGVKVNDPTNSRGGAFDLGTLDPNLIEQVEIFYGSHSTVFGSDALAGVISIQTKNVEKDRIGTVSLKVSSNNSLGGSIHMGAKLSNVAQLKVSGSLQNNDDSTFGDNFERKQVIASIQSINSKSTKWDLGYFYANGEAASFPEDSGGDRLSIIQTPETRHYKQKNVNANLQHKLTNALIFNFKSAWSEREEDISNPGIAPGVFDGVPAIDSLANYERIDVSSTLSYFLSNQLTIAIGAALSEEDGGMESIIDFGSPVPADYTLDRKTTSIFSEMGYDPLTNLNFTLALRHDKADDITVNTHRFITRYQLNTTTDISLQFSEGFKLPSFFAVGHPFVGNPLLKPELSENYDLTLKNQFLNNKLAITTSIYKNNFTNLVDFDPIAFTNVNRSKVEAKGAEVSFTYLASKQIKIAGQVSYNKLDTFDSAVKLRRRPELKGGFSISYLPSEVFSLNARVTFNDNYYDSSIPTGVIEMDSYNRVDASAAWHVKKDITLRFNVNNILNDDYEESVGFNNMGRNLTMSIAKDF